MGLTQITTGGVDDNINIDSNTLKVDGTNNRVGVGTDAPGALLDVKASSSRQIRVATESSNNAGLVQCTESSGNNRDIALGGQNVTFCVGAFDTTSRSEVGRFDTSGRLLIGGTNTYHASADDLVVQGTGHVGVTIASTSTGKSNLYFADDTSNPGTYACYFEYDHNSDFLKIGQGNSERIRLDNAGRVMLGTTTSGVADADQLTIASPSSTGITIRGSSSGNGNVFFSDTTSGTGQYDGFIQYQHSSRALKFGTAAAEKVRISSSGDVGIGNTSPANSTGYNTLTIGNGTSTGGQILLENSSGNNFFIWHDSNGSNIYNQSATSQIFYTNATERMRIGSTGNVGIGTSSPSFKLHCVENGSAAGICASSNVTADALASRFALGNSVGTARFTINMKGGGSELAYLGSEGNFPFYFQTNGAERMRIDSSGVVSINQSSASNIFRIQSSGSSEANMLFQNSATSGLGAGNGLYVGIDPSANAYLWNYENNPVIFATNNSERARVTNDGHLLVAKSTTDFNTAGHLIGVTGSVDHTRDNAPIMYLNRTSSDGSLVQFYQAGNLEGSISVSGSTVSYNGGHLTRWSQLASGAARTEILRGSVLSNLDEMCEWGEENNEQLNRMKVSDVEGDANVSGVFQAWDDDDDTYTNDFYCAMTGDFVIRIAQGTTVARGDLLMSAGDGTAKPQDDDIVRSKTIAKVTSTTVSTTYSDGSYCIPCVLMAC